MVLQTGTVALLSPPHAVPELDTPSRSCFAHCHCWTLIQGPGTFSRSHTSTDGAMGPKRCYTANAPTSLPRSCRSLRTRSTHRSPLEPGFQGHGVTRSQRMLRGCLKKPACHDLALRCQRSHGESIVVSQATLDDEREVVSRGGHEMVGRGAMGKLAEWVEGSLSPPRYQTEY